MKVLVVDDDDISLELLSQTIRLAGHDVEVARNGQQALERLRTDDFRLVVSDWVMPGMSGIELCRTIRARSYGRYVYFILVTTRDATEDLIVALDAGADEFITKPVQPAELSVRLRVGERLLSLEGRDVTILALAKIADARDRETGVHLERMREYCRVISEDLSAQPKFRGTVDRQYIEMIYAVSPLHDMGKVGIPDAILHKPGKLTPEEYDVMKQHTLIGAETLDETLRAHPEAGFLHMAKDIAVTHHEKWDGSGYPHGLAGEQIPLCGRIVALADVYDALTTKRVYKPAYAHGVARDMIIEQSGLHFDPEIVEAFVRTEAEFVAVHERFDQRELEMQGPTPEMQRDTW